MTPLPIPADDSGLFLDFDGCHNFRAVAGWSTRCGRRLSSGRLFRSDELSQLSDKDHDLLSKLGIAQVFDLRANAEIERAPSRWPAAMTPRIWAGAESAAEADIGAMMQRDEVDVAAFKNAMCSIYSRFPDDLAEAVRALSEAILADANGAHLVHCTAGKDRTGFAIAMILHAVGVGRDEVMAEYLLSNARFDAARSRFNMDGRLDRVETLAPGAITALVGVHPEYLRAAEQRIEGDFMSIDAWLESYAGLDVERRARLADRLLE
jgi:protein-tyrosine phosphatase